MTTYLDMITRIQDDMVNTSVTVAQIKAAIQTAIGAYEADPFFFNQKTATFNTVANQEYYAAAALSDIPYIVSFYSMQLSATGYSRAVQAVDYKVMDDQQNGSVVGVPYWYAYYASQIRFFPEPDSAYAVSLSYIYKLVALSADSDTNSWMTDGEEMIRQAAKRRLALDTLYDDALAARCKMLEDEAYDGLKMESRSKLPNTTLAIPAMGVSNGGFNINRGY